MEAHHIDATTGLDEMDSRYYNQALPPEVIEELAMVDRALAGGASARPITAKSNPVVRKAASGVDPNAPESWGKVSRNAGCPCGSGKKYKHCHGKDE
jgi:preprotein translocase subunit SecA